MRRDLTTQLLDAGLALFWTVLASSELHDTDDSRPDDDYRWVSGSAAYMLTATTVECIGATAAKWRPGPATEYEVEWPVKASEP